MKIDNFKCPDCEKNDVLTLEQINDEVWLSCMNCQFVFEKLVITNVKGIKGDLENESKNN